MLKFFTMMMIVILSFTSTSYSADIGTGSPPPIASCACGVNCPCGPDCQCGTDCKCGEVSKALAMVLTGVTGGTDMLASTPVTQNVISPIYYSSAPVYQGFTSYTSDGEYVETGVYTVATRRRGPVRRVFAAMAARRALRRSVAVVPVQVAPVATVSYVQAPQPVFETVTEDRQVTRLEPVTRTVNVTSMEPVTRTEKVQVTRPVVTTAAPVAAPTQTAPVPTFSAAPVYAPAPVYYAAPRATRQKICVGNTCYWVN